MDKRLTGVLAAAATVATVGAAQALPQANSYAELLVSVPNSTNVLKADDQARAEGKRGCSWCNSTITTIIIPIASSSATTITIITT
jgi:hypothetical protein